MKHSKLLTSTVAAAALAASVSFAPVASAEISGSVAVASSYLWRGMDLGSGTPAVSGDIGYSTGSDAFGFHADLWGSSGDTAAGTEWDLILGVGGSAGSFSWDVSAVSYVYPTGAGYTGGDTDVGEFVDLVLAFGVGPVSLTYYQTVEGEDVVWADEDYFYLNLGVAFGDWNVALGMHDEGISGATLAAGDSPVHLQVDYAYNDNLTFTMTKFVIDEDFVDDDLQFVVSYSIPIE